ncbi:TPA: hypothetical protein ACGJ2U_004907 [Pseudomonas aeruginosa]
MNDRELLELAARAAGIDPVLAEPINFSTGVEYYWNPLTDDGDALRLAVKLGLHVKVCRRMVLVEQREVGDDKIERLHSDPYAATRRAIVRAAAEIGKSITQPGATSSP